MKPGPPPETRNNPSFLETPQQELHVFFDESFQVDETLQYALDRSCTPHCVEAIAELTGQRIPSLEQLDQYIAFLTKYGANSEREHEQSRLYDVDDGWYNIAIADLLRLNGFQVVSQNMTLNPSHANSDLALQAGRVRGVHEKSVLESLTTFGGPKKRDWLGALRVTREDNGYPLVSLTIPSSKRPGELSRHSVVVLGNNEGVVRYYDPDKLAIERYKDRAAEQEISRVDDSKLVYTQPVGQFSERMTGEVLHIFPPT